MLKCFFVTNNKGQFGGLFTSLSKEEVEFAEECLKSDSFLKKISIEKYIDLMPKVPEFNPWKDTSDEPSDMSHYYDDYFDDWDRMEREYPDEVKNASDKQLLDMYTSELNSSKINDLPTKENALIHLEILKREINKRGLKIKEEKKMRDVKKITEAILNGADIRKSLYEETKKRFRII